MRKEFERVSPESLGIRSADIQELLDILESGITEPHGLMIMRHGKICAEGWWSPYAPGMRHALMSHTKTYAGTAVGIAITEGLVGLDTLLLDIFPDKAPENPSEELKRLKVRHVLCMGSGMPRMPQQGLDWVRDFLAAEIQYEPGTHFIYSTMCEMLAAIVRRVSGLGAFDYLKSRLFEPLGIDWKNLRWARMGDGCEFCSAGLQATTEDNLRLLKLYLNGGVWEGKRILSEEFVKLATTTQIELPLREGMPVPEGPRPGYGYMIWMCSIPGSYRADGMGGQYSIVIPQKDMIVSITQYDAEPYKTVDAILKFVEKCPDEALPEDEAAAAALRARMGRLALPNEPYAPNSSRRESVSGVKWKIASGNFSLSSFRFDGKQTGIESFVIDFNEDTAKFTFTQNGQDVTAIAAIDGSRHWNEVSGDRVFVSAAWIKDDTLRLVWRAAEGMFTKRFDFVFSGTRCDVQSVGPAIRVPGGREPEPIIAVMA